MEPAYERVKQTTDAEGNVHQERQAIIMERHERVVVPVSEQRTTTIVVNQPRLEKQTTYRATYRKRAVAYSPRAKATTRIAHRVRRAPSNVIAVI